MGTWDATSFGNDDASDFAADLVESGDAGMIAEALRAATDNGDYLEAPESHQAITAAEVVAAMNGHSAVDLPEELASWVTEQGAAGADLVALAHRAVERVASHSELKELWEEGDASKWEAHVSDLQRRLA